MDKRRLMNVYIQSKIAAKKGLLTVPHVNGSTVTVAVKANFYPFPPSILRPDAGPQCHCHQVAAIKTDSSLLPVWHILPPTRGRKHGHS